MCGMDEKTIFFFQCSVFLKCYSIGGSRKGVEWTK